MCIFVVQTNGKDLMSEKQGTLLSKAAAGYFEFPH